jgi:hypothetical protein
VFADSIEYVVDSVANNSRALSGKARLGGGLVSNDGTFDFSLALLPDSMSRELLVDPRASLRERGSAEIHRLAVGLDVTAQEPIAMACDAWNELITAHEMSRFTANRANVCAMLLRKFTAQTRKHILTVTRLEAHMGVSRRVLFGAIRGLEAARLDSQVGVDAYLDLICDILSCNGADRDLLSTFHARYRAYEERAVYAAMPSRSHLYVNARSSQPLFRHAAEVIAVAICVASCIPSVAHAAKTGVAADPDETDRKARKPFRSIATLSRWLQSRVFHNQRRRGGRRRAVAPAAHAGAVRSIRVA